MNSPSPRGSLPVPLPLGSPRPQANSGNGELVRFDQPCGPGERATRLHQGSTPANDGLQVFQTPCW